MALKTRTLRPRGRRHPREGAAGGSGSAERDRGALPIAVRVGVDTGGTFTDIAVVWRGGAAFLKMPSTPSDPAEAVLEGLARLGVNRPGTVIGHGSTVATNALLERKGGPAALVTTAGFEDLIEIGRQARPFLYDWNARPPEPLVPRALRFGVAERTTEAGRLHPLTASARGQLERLSRRLARAGVAAAVGFLHSYRDGRNEREAGRILQRAGVRVTLSHRIAGEYREFERFSTAAANAWLQPVMAAHLQTLAARLAAPLRVLQSSGLTAKAARVAQEPVRAVLSGPAGGVLAAAEAASRARLGPLITLDMGGTSTDVSLVDGPPPEVPHVHESAIAGVALRLRSVHVETVGAGGGSIARLDAGGALRVGPDSAGADPGPACYGRGDDPTVTDAHLVLGRLGPDDLLGGAVRLDPERARAAIGRLGGAMGRSPEGAALGILAVTTSSMERALRAVSLRRGHDPRRFSLFAYGGASALHAGALAEAMELKRIVVPPSPGTFSALGVALAPAGADVARTVLRPAGEAGRLEPEWRRLERAAASALAREGVPRARLRFERTADLRWRGQSHEITVPGGRDLLRRFEAAYRRLYGGERIAGEAEIVTLRVRAAERTAPLPPARRPGRAGRRAAPDGIVPMILDDGTVARTPWFHRERLPAGFRIRGPARIVEYSSTTIVLPGWVARAGAEGMMILERAREPRRS